MVVGKTAFVEIWSHQNWRKMSAMWAVKILDNVKQNSNNMQTCSSKTKATFPIVVGWVGFVGFDTVTSKSKDKIRNREV